VDLAGNEAATTVTYHVRYLYSGVLPLLGEGRVFNPGSVIPVKFQLTDAGGSFINNAEARLYLAPVVEGITGTETAAVSSGQSNYDNLFRYDSTDNLYIFNLESKTFTSGLWQLRIEFDDGTSKYVSITLASKGKEPDEGGNTNRGKH
jgi:hypothetical protein